MRAPLPSIGRAALLLSDLLICAPAFAQSSAAANGAPPWSDDALVEFVFYDNSRWVGLPAGDKAGRPVPPPTGGQRE